MMHAEIQQVAAPAVVSLDHAEVVTIGTITAEKRREGQKNGREAQRKRAKEIRRTWWDVSFRAMLDAFYTDRNWLTKKEVFAELRRYNLAYGITGKEQGQIKKRTLTRWLSNDRWSVLCVAVVEEIAAREVRSALVSKQ